MMATSTMAGQKHLKAKVCLVGDVAVGKTSLIKRFVQDQFYDLNNWVQMIRKQVGNVPMVFLGNKMDLTERLVVSQEELARMGSIHSAPQFLASAKTGAGVNEAFRALADAIGHRGNE